MRFAFAGLGRPPGLYSASLKSPPASLDCVFDFPVRAIGKMADSCLGVEGAGSAMFDTLDGPGTDTDPSTPEVCGASEAWSAVSLREICSSV